MERSARLVLLLVLGPALLVATAASVAALAPPGSGLPEPRLAPAERCTGPGTAVDPLCAYGAVACVAVPLYVDVSPRATAPSAVTLLLAESAAGVSGAGSAHDEAFLHEADLGPMAGARALDSSCDAESAAANSACGVASAGSFRLDLTGLRIPLDIQGWALREAGCSSAHAGGSNDSTIVYATGTANGVPFIGALRPEPNTVIPLGDAAVLVLNEQHASGSGPCVRNEGAALHLAVADPQSTNPLAEVIVGWVSTVACRFPSTTITIPSASEVVVGEAVWGNAGVTGAGLTPTGSVAFFLCDRGVVPCASGGTPLGRVTLEPSGAADSAPFTPPLPGTYCFRAEYSGDDVYIPSSDGGPGGCFLARRAPSQTTSAPSSPSVAYGEPVWDTAVVTGGVGTPTGSVDFFLCGPDAGPCGSGGGFVGTATLDGAGVAVSSPVAPPSPGLWCFRAAYGGDARYEPSEDAGPGGCFEVHRVTPTITARTTQLPDASWQDLATVSGSGPVPTGTVQFFLCEPSEVTPGGCEAPAGAPTGGPVALDGFGQAISPPVLHSDPGLHCWRAEYTGDAYYTPAAHTNADTDCFFQQVAPRIDTQVVPDAQGGWRDEARVSGAGPVPTGNVRFFLCEPADITPAGCPGPSGSPLGGPVPLDAGGHAVSPQVFDTAAGPHCFRVEYAGDATYTPAGHTNPRTECFSDDPLMAVVDTESRPGPREGPQPPGTVIVDDAFMTWPWEIVPTGTITFFLCAPAEVVPGVGCPQPAGSLIGTRPFEGAAVTTSDAVAPSTPGEYCWRAEYGGDSLHPPYVHTDHELECFTVVPPPPGARVDVENFQFTPADVTIAAGGEVTWTWVSGFHSVVSTDGEEWCFARFAPAPDCSKTFAAPGDYAYFCGIHGPAMAGVVRVT